MGETTWARVTGIVAIVSVIAWWTGAFIDAALGDPDPATADAADITAFMAGHATSGPARLAFALSAFLLIWFVAGLYDRLRQARVDPVIGTAALGSGLVAAALMLMGNAGWLAAAFPAVGRLDQDATVLAYAVQLAPGMTAAIGFAGLLLAVGIAAIIHRVLPRWLGWAAVVIAIGELVGYLDPLAGPLAPIMILRMLWIVAVGVVLIARPVPKLAPHLVPAVA